jgi:hypothetical protein
MPRLRFPADQAVGTLEWSGSEAQEPVLALGEIVVPEGVEVTLEVEIITSVHRSGPGQHTGTGLWFELKGGSVAARGPLLTGAEYTYELEGSGDPVDLGFLRELPDDGIADLHLTWPLVPESIAAITHLAPGLRRLCLANTGLRDDALAHVARLRGLTYLQTYGNKFTDEGVKQLAALTEIDHLYLEEESLTVAALGFTRHLPKLVRLGLQDVPLTAGELSELKAQLPAVDVG